MSRQIPIVRFVVDALIVSLCPFSKQRHVAVSMTFFACATGSVGRKERCFGPRALLRETWFFALFNTIGILGRCPQFPIESPSSIST